MQESLLHGDSVGLPSAFSERITGEASARPALIAAAAALVSYGVGIGGLFMLGWAFSALCVNIPDALAQAYEGCFNPKEMAGFLLAYTFLPLGIMSMILAIVLLSRFREAILGYFLGFLVSVVGIVTSIVFLMRPATTYDGDKHDTFQVLIGGMLVAVFFPYAIAFLIATFNKSKAASERGMDPAQFKAAAPPLEPVGLKANWKGVVLAVLVCVIGTVAASAFSPVWNFSAKSYFPFVSPYTLTPNWVVNPKFNWKVYADVLVYFGALLGLIAVAAAVQASPAARRLAAKRHRFPFPAFLPMWLHPFPLGVCTGELFCIFWATGLTTWWLIYWRYIYTRIVEETVDDEYQMWQVWARVLGHMLNLVLSFLIFPTARDSIWERVFGIPYERTVKYHRFFGRLTYALLTVHLLLWWVKWMLEGIFWENLGTVTMLQIHLGKFHYDNFTIVLCELTWIGTTIMVYLAQFSRRDNYEAFYYAHHFAVFFLLTAVIHAWGFWYYGAAPILLWVFDRALRTVRGCEEVQVKEFVHRGDTVKLVLNGRFEHFAGQYAFLNFPAISSLQWHPFSIASAPGSSFKEFYIKDMGPQTFTRDLAELAIGVEKEGIDPRTLSVGCDAPYGRAAYYSDHHVLLLVAGGIGITPMISIAHDLYLRRKLGLPIGDITKVVLVWSARSDTMLQACADKVCDLVADSPFFEVILNATTHTQSDNTLETVSHQKPTIFPGISEAALAAVRSVTSRGRPDLAAIFKEVWSNASAKRVMAMACGPEGLVGSVSELAFTHGMSFHSETFLL